MLKNIQIKIVLIFLLIGTIIIGTMGYLNYTDIEKINKIYESSTGEYIQEVEEYQNNIKILTISTIFVFALACIVVRGFGNSKNCSTNYKIN